MECRALDSRKPSSCVGVNWGDNQNLTLNLDATEWGAGPRLVQILDLPGQHRVWPKVWWSLWKTLRHDRAMNWRVFRKLDVGFGLTGFLALRWNVSRRRSLRPELSVSKCESTNNYAILCLFVDGLSLVGNVCRSFLAEGKTVLRLE